MKKYTQTKSVNSLTLFVFFVICVNANVAIASSQLMQKRIEINCQGPLQECPLLEQSLEIRPQKIYHYQQKFLLIEFEQALNLEKIRDYFNQSETPKRQQRQLLKMFLSTLNQKSLKHFQPTLSELTKRELIGRVQPLVINNSVLLELEPSNYEQVLRIVDSSNADHINKSKIIEKTAPLATQSSLQSSQQKAKKNAASLKDNSKAFSQLVFDKLAQQKASMDVTIALIDSGVSTQHQELHHLGHLKQYNPKDNSYEQKDTGFGHGTGVLSLLASSNQFQRSISVLPKANYLSCNGLPSGRYHYIWVVACYDWLLQQPRVDIAINSWLQPELQCNDELLYSLRALWLANTIPVFSAGNFGKYELTSRDPVNFKLFDDVPLISVGATTADFKPYADSSYGDNLCGNGVVSPTISTIGTELLVAHPFNRDSYQIVNGTSYSVALVAAAIAILIEQAPEAPLELIVKSLIENSDTIAEHPFLLKALNLQRSVRQLRQNNTQLSIMDD
ncbi:hypothetical protein DL796_07360 [Kangiella spongicola]|uniref:Peptidase S8/S53 domain-containing protein n=2 Tax=Kangiella spongicola TaxID=796379 RepID=A0A318D363_9GAMM|nr:hypothetical protein DL796_07360 [Kangiella spongicola]